LRGEYELAEVGVFERLYPDLSSEKIAGKLAENLTCQKQVTQQALQQVEDNKNMTFNNSVRQGVAMQKRSLQSSLRGYNGECDAAIAGIRHTNIETAINKINRAFKFYCDGATKMSINFPSRLLDLRREQAELVHEIALQKQREKEEQAEIRAQIREEERALREFEKAREDAEKEAAKYEELLSKAKAEASKEATAQHLQAVEKLEALLAEANQNRERAISRAQLTRSGHVYVISNIGSFGESVFKVGMTRRFEPLDRIAELGDASVPFPFDIHALIFTNDAPGLETAIHRRIWNTRVNLVNERREFFSINYDALYAAITEAARDVDVTFSIHWTRVAEAEQFRQSLRERKHAQEKPLVSA
jgi:hypothetical protein